MVLGLPPLTFLHTLLSLVGIVTGWVAMVGLLNNTWLAGWNAWFLWTTVLTSVSGFVLPATHLMPSHIVGILSLAVLALALYALYAKHLAGSWRTTYVITAPIALYFNVFVLVAQLFAKVPALKALAPTQTEAPFKLAQMLVLIVFIVLDIQARRRFHVDVRAAST